MDDKLIRRNNLRAMLRAAKTYFIKNKIASKDQIALDLSEINLTDLEKLKEDVYFRSHVKKEWMENKKKNKYKKAINKYRVLKKEIKKKYDNYKGKCMTIKSENCKDSVIMAHSIQKGNMLRYLSSKNIKRENNNHLGTIIHEEFERVGIKKASVFRGMCSYHDRNDYSIFEVNEFSESKEQLYMMHYRSLSMETFKKENLLNIIISDYVDIKSLRMSKKDKKDLEERSINQRVTDFWDYGIYLKNLKKLKKLYQENKEIDISSYVFYISGDINFAASGVFMLYEDDEALLCNEDLPPISLVSINTIKITDNKFAVIFSFNKENEKIQKYFNKNYHSKNKKSIKKLFLLILEKIENVYFNIEWYEGLKDEEKKNLIKISYENTNFYYLESENNLKEISFIAPKDTFIEKISIIK